MKSCSDVMTKNPTCCLPTDVASKAGLLMKNENVGSIPVIESKQTRKLIGIVTDRDLAMLVVAAGRDVQTTRVADVMTQNVVTCRLDDGVQKALDAMAKFQLRRIPVVDNEDRVVGIIAQADVATRVDQPEETAEVVKEISQPTA